MFHGYAKLPEGINRRTKPAKRKAESTVDLATIADPWAEAAPELQGYAGIG